MNKFDESKVNRKNGRFANKPREEMEIPEFPKDWDKITESDPNRNLVKRYTDSDAPFNEDYDRPPLRDYDDTDDEFWGEDFDDDYDYVDADYDPDAADREADRYENWIMRDR